MKMEGVNQHLSFGCWNLLLCVRIQKVVKSTILASSFDRIKEKTYKKWR